MLPAGAEVLREPVFYTLSGQGQLGNVGKKHSHQVAAKFYGALSGNVSRRNANSEETFVVCNLI